MSYTYSFNTLAQQDYEASLEWYLERSEKAAENFVTAVDIGIDLICNNPLRWRNQYRNFYELTLRKYPFSIIYTIDEDLQSVIITAIYHHKRNPKKRYTK